MLAVLIDLDLHVPAAQSLKDKRGVVRRLQARLRKDLAISVAEIDHLDTWQRCGLGVAIAASSEIAGRKVAQQVERIVARTPEVAIIGIHVQVVQSEP